MDARQKLFVLRFIVGLVFVWCVALPFFWSYNISQQTQIEYFSLLSTFAPELLVGVCAAVLLFAAWRAHQWAPYRGGVAPAQGG